MYYKKLCCNVVVVDKNHEAILVRAPALAVPFFLKGNVCMGQVIKRDGCYVKYEPSKINVAIQKANRDVRDSEQASEVIIKKIVDAITKRIAVNNLSVEEIQDLVEEGLMKNHLYVLAKAYIVFRYERAMLRKSNDTDDCILQLIRNDSKHLREENSNKNTVLGSTQRDYISGIVSTDIAKRVLLPEDVVKAHEDGILHFHDLDYFLQPIINCCLIDIKDTLDNSAVINRKLIDSPKSFQVACTVTTQIIANIASNQYGGQSVNISHLAKYLAVTEKKYRELFIDILSGNYETSKLSENDLLELAEPIKLLKNISNREGNAFVDVFTKTLMKKELKDGIQTIQYQINTLMTTNGQAPFVTLFLMIDDEDPYCKYNAMVIEEILRQRLEGIKNEKGIWVTPAFPKLVYVLDECNCLKGGKFDYLTRLAVKCSSKRMYPDYVSAKKMRENYEGNVFSPMGCRSFLAPWKDEEGNYKFEGRFNQGVVSINLPQIAILANGDGSVFWELLEQRLAMCFKALMCRHKALEGTLSDISPLHWQYGAIARLKKGETIDRLLHGGYSTLSLGYIGFYEMVVLMTGKSNTSPEGREFALKVMQRMKDACASWKRATGIGFALYGTPAESLCYRFAEIDRKRFGDIENVTDKGYYTNSYHVDVREPIDAFKKLKFESEFQDLSSGGAISYVEVPNMADNLEAMEAVVKFIYENVQYAEFNTKSDYCQKCGFSGEITINQEMQWECPQCHNTDKDTMNIVRRTCGYLGENYWNVGKTKEISQRVLHL